MGMIVGNKEYLDCSECSHCKPQGIRKKGNYGEGYKYGICGHGGNIVFLEPWKEKRLYGGGYIHHNASSCGLYEKENGRENK